MCAIIIGESHSFQFSKATLALLAAACGITVGNVYLCQPLLNQIAVSMGVPAQIAGLVAVGAQVGYALGLMFVLPLADVVAARRLVRLLLVLTALSLLVAALSPTPPVLILASVTLATTTVVPQVLIPIVSRCVTPEQRGRMIGTLKTGLILGILLSRTVSGSLAEASDSWRSPYLLAAVLTASLIFIVPPLLPAHQTPPIKTRYIDLLRSLPALLGHRALCLSMALGFLVFAAFSAFWATLAFHLATPTFGLGPAAAGMFGLYGAMGALLAPRAGRLSDSIGAVKVNLVALASVALAFLLAGSAGAFSTIALVISVNLLDFGLQSGQIANQVRIFALGNHIHARVNSLFMVSTFSGGAVGSFVGIFVWQFAGWHGVCVLALVLVSIAVSLVLIQREADQICTENE